MRIRDGSSDVCSSDLSLDHVGVRFGLGYPGGDAPGEVLIRALRKPREQREEPFGRLLGTLLQFARQLHCAASEAIATPPHFFPRPAELARSEEHTSELQSLMRISYAVFCLKKKNNNYTQTR